MRYNFACALANLDDVDGSRGMLEPVFSQCAQTIIKIAESDVDLDKLRNDSRFKAPAPSPAP